MKKKFCILVTVLLAILLLFSACGSEPPTGIHQPRVQRQYGLQEYGPYIFYSRGRVMKYNRTTDEVSKACADPECKGDCLLDSPITWVNPIVDGVLYFSSFTPYTHVQTYAGYDVISGEITAIVTLSEAEAGDNAIHGVCQGELYYTRNVLKDGGDKTNPADYAPYYCKTPVSGGAETRLCPTDGAVLLGIYEGQMMAQKDGKLTLTDPNSGDCRDLLDLEAQGYISLGSTVSFIGDTAVFACKTMQQELWLTSLDLKTGESRKLSERPVFSFCVTDSGVCYFPMVMQKQAFKTEDGSVEWLQVQAQDKMLMRCNPDGSNTETVFTDEYFYCSTDFTVIDGEVIGEMTRVEPDAGSPGQAADSGAIALQEQQARDSRRSMGRYNWTTGEIVYSKNV